MVYVILGEFSTLTSKDQQCVIFNVGTIQLKSLLPFSNPPSNSLQQANKPIHHYGSLRIRTLKYSVPLSILYFYLRSKIYFRGEFNSDFLL